MLEPGRRIFSENELRSLLLKFEDSFVERKTFADKEGWMKTIVAFANSCPYEGAGVLFIGAENSGNIQEMKEQQNLEELERTVGEHLGKRIFPQVSVEYRVVEQSGRQCLAVIVPGSRKRPHFDGKAWMRDGGQTKRLAENQYAELFAQRTDKVYEILRWKGKEITVELRGARGTSSFFTPVVEDCDASRVTLKTGDNLKDIPLKKIELSRDYARNGRLKLEVDQS